MDAYGKRRSGTEVPRTNRKMLLCSPMWCCSNETFHTLKPLLFMGNMGKHASSSTQTDNMLLMTFNTFFMCGLGLQ